MKAAKSGRRPNSQRLLSPHLVFTVLQNMKIYLATISIRVRIYKYCNIYQNVGNPFWNVQLCVKQQHWGSMLFIWHVCPRMLYPQWLE